jgi:putative tryptophan/tyrosine transport system substrate-binding protein
MAAVLSQRARCAVLAAILLVPPLSLEAQQAAKVHTIGFLGPTPAPAAAHLLTAFREGLRTLGYVEGQSIRIESRWADGDYSRLPQLAQELVAAGVDVIVAPTPPAVRAAKHATATIPIVMLNVSDPVGAGLIADLSRPGGNVTGQTNDAPGLGAKLVGLAKEIAPGARGVAVLRNPANPAAALQLGELEPEIRAAQLDLHPFEARDPAQLETVLLTIGTNRADVVIVRADPMFFSERKRLAELAIAQRLPTVFERREYSDAGGLSAYGPSLSGQFRRAATYVDKILKGAKPADLAVEQPAKFELVINMKTAKALDLTIPPSLLLRADHVIE